MTRSRFARIGWLRELALIGVLYACYDTVRGLVSAGTSHAEHDGRLVLHIERVLHIAIEHSVNNVVTGSAWLAVPACFFYATLHFVITPAVLIWVYRWQRRAYAWVRTSLGVITAASLLGFWLFPTAPPRLLPGSGFRDTLAVYHGWGWWGAGSSVPAAAASLANDYAAMPSLHMAWAAWCGATVFFLARRRWVRALGLCYPVLTALVVLGTANHYLLDVIAGVVLWLGAHVATSRYQQLRVVS